MTATPEVVSGAEPGAARITVGRVASNDLVLPSPQVSREHAVVVRAAADAPWVISDLKSTNRTYVNGEAIAERQLREGDVIRIGPYRLTVRQGEIEHFDETTGILLEALNLRKLVGKGTAILQDITLVVQPHEFVAVVGVGGVLMLAGVVFTLQGVGVLGGSVMSGVTLKPTSLNAHVSPVGIGAGSAWPPKMDCAISVRSMARLSASRTRLSLVGGVRPSGPSTHQTCRIASSLRK